MLVVAIYPRCIAASGNGACTGPERQALPSRRGRFRPMSQDPVSAVCGHMRLGLGRRLLHLQPLRVPDRALSRCRRNHPRAQSLYRGGSDSVLLGWLRRGYPRGAVLVPNAVVQRKRLMPGIVGSSVGVHPLLVLFATLHVPTFFERWQKVPVVEAIVEEAPGVAASGGGGGGRRGGRGGGGGRGRGGPWKGGRGVGRPGARGLRASGAAPGEGGRPPWGCRTESHGGLSPTRRLSGSLYVPWLASSRQSGFALIR